MVASKILCALAVTLAMLSSTASAKPVPKGKHTRGAKASTAPKAPVAASTPVCNSANNGAWQCIPDRAQCYLGTWYSYPCSGGTVCNPSNGQCEWSAGTTSTTIPTTISTTTRSPTTTTKPTTTTTKAVTTTSKTTTSSVPVSTGKAKFITYIDNTGGSSSAAIFNVPGSVPKNAYNIINLGFWQSYGPWDTAYTWSTTLDATTRQSYVSSMHAAGVKILVTAFGAAEAPTSAGVNPTTAANNLATFVKANGFDGADIDWEDSNAMQAGTGEAWLITFTQALRAQLPSPQYIITHAPQAPYFIDDKTLYPKGAYITVDAQVGHLIDWYNVQWYNQATSTYDTCQTLLFQANGWATGTSLFELIGRGFAQEKLVIGKPVTTAGATNTGYMDVNTLAGCLSQAKAKGWNAGVMGWQFTLDPSGSWINTLAATF